MSKLAGLFLLKGGKRDQPAWISDFEQSFGKSTGKYHLRWDRLYYTCNLKTLQNTAKRCNTLQHTDMFCIKCVILRQFWFLSYFVMNVFMFARIRTRTRTRIGNVIYVCTANLTIGDIFAKLFQSSKFKAQSSNISFHWNEAKETCELWALSFETALENVTPGGIGCTWTMLKASMQFSPCHWVSRTTKSK